MAVSLKILSWNTMEYGGAFSPDFGCPLEIERRDDALALFTHDVSSAQDNLTQERFDRLKATFVEEEFPWDDENEENEEDSIFNKLDLILLQEVTMNDEASMGTQDWTTGLMTQLDFFGYKAVDCGMSMDSSTIHSTFGRKVNAQPIWYREESGIVPTAAIPLENALMEGNCLVEFSLPKAGRNLAEEWDPNEEGVMEDDGASFFIVNLHADAGRMRDPEYRESGLDELWAELEWIFTKQDIFFSDDFSDDGGMSVGEFDALADVGEDEDEEIAEYVVSSSDTPSMDEDEFTEQPESDDRSDKGNETSSEDVEIGDGVDSEVFDEEVMDTEQPASTDDLSEEDAETDEFVSVDDLDEAFMPSNSTNSSSFDGDNSNSTRALQHANSRLRKREDWMDRLILCGDWNVHLSDVVLKDWLSSEHGLLDNSTGINFSTNHEDGYLAQFDGCITGAAFRIATVDRKTEGFMPKGEDAQLDERFRYDAADGALYVDGSLIPGASAKSGLSDHLRVYTWLTLDE